MLHLALWEDEDAITATDLWLQCAHFEEPTAAARLEGIRVAPSLPK